MAPSENEFDTPELESVRATRFGEREPVPLNKEQRPRTSLHSRVISLASAGEAQIPEAGGMPAMGAHKHGVTQAEAGKRLFYTPSTPTEATEQMGTPASSGITGKMDAWVSSPVSTHSTLKDISSASPHCTVHPLAG